MQTLSSGLLIQNFTELGFGLARCPDELIETLRTAIREGLPTAGSEGAIDVINGAEAPLLITRPDLTKRVHMELLPFAEEWTGIELVPSIAYGFRLYQVRKLDETNC
jgi:hypothetical protein